MRIINYFSGLFFVSCTVHMMADKLYLFVLILIFKPLYPFLMRQMKYLAYNAIFTPLPCRTVKEDPVYMRIIH